MKLTEARYSNPNTKVWWVENLSYHSMFDKQDPPFIDPKTGAIVISFDARKHNGEYVNSYIIRQAGTGIYDILKWEIPWAIEIAGTERQMKDFLDLNFQYDEKDIHHATVWTPEAIDGLIKHLTKQPRERDVNEQVSRILEAKYHREPTAEEVFVIYDEFLQKHQKKFLVGAKFGSIIIVDADYIQGMQETNWAAMYLWVLDSSVEQAEKEIAEFAQQFELPYTSIRIDENIKVPGFKYTRLHCTLIYEQEGQLREARYAGSNLPVEKVLDRYKTITNEIRDQNPERYHFYDSPETGRIGFTAPIIDTENNRSPTVELAILIHSCKNQEEANKKLGAFINKFNIPYNDIKRGTETTYDGKYPFIIQYRNPNITEATYSGNKFVTDFRRALEDVKSEPFNDVTLVSDMSYDATFSALENMLGRPQWIDYEYGAPSQPYWLLDNDTVWIEIQKRVLRHAHINFVRDLVCDVILQYDPNGFSS